MSLKDYQAKRDFDRTREPAGKVRSTSQARQASFVVQKHDATRLHYDFRLEMDGVLKSWAVPKGFPTRRGERRLALQVEDHPLDYADFEGIIPKGNYGAGTVMVWDRGAYEVLGAEPSRALAQGKLHLRLRGRKLKGEWTLVRMRGSEDKPQWLLLKSGVDLPDLSARAENQSVLSQRTLAQIGAAADRQWQSNREPSGQRSASASRSPNRRHPPARKPPASKAAPVIINRQRLPALQPGFIEPMKALLVDELPQGPQWIYEVKFDGVRALAAKDKRKVTLTSRNDKPLEGKYPQIASALRGLPAGKAILDGEITALDPQGRSSFQLLQSYLANGDERPPLVYYVFDLLSLENKDLRGLPLWQRKAAAESLVKACGSSVIRFSPGIRADSARVMRAMRARGLEGLVAKRKDSHYEPGRRSGAWVKFKWTNQQEFVIGGYTEPQGARAYFGAILVGYYEAGQFRFAAKVGTGFNQKVLWALYEKFKDLISPECPFVNLPEKPLGNRGGLTAAEMRRCTWLRPELVCEVRFAEWTRDRHLRQPAFLGLREDKKARDVLREEPRAA